MAGMRPLSEITPELSAVTSSLLPTVVPANKLNPSLMEPLEQGSPCVNTCGWGVVPRACRACALRCVSGDNSKATRR
eukprot:351323-Pyramimonas_sp.AAC.1